MADDPIPFCMAGAAIEESNLLPIPMPEDGVCLAAKCHPNYSVVAYLHLHPKDSNAPLLVILCEKCGKPVVEVELQDEMKVRLRNKEDLDRAGGFR